jgi:hypothetical protein
LITPPAIALKERTRVTRLAKESARYTTQARSFLV